MGDPAGVGPEVVLKALERDEVWRVSRPLVIGDAGTLRQVKRSLALALSICPCRQPGEAVFESRSVQVLDLENVDLTRLQPGAVSGLCGGAAAEYVFRAADLALAGDVSAIATASINKAALREAGLSYLGHTEILAERCGAKHVAMMLVTPGRGGEERWLRVIHVTTHIPLAEVPAAITEDEILRVIALASEGLYGLGIDDPRLAVAALNPHASDEGLMGDEEARVIAPAVEAGRSQGFSLAGPIPADTVFLRALRGEYDGVIALYHDQGHIAVKTHGFERAVNVTLGLPIIRTSVDHGTAFDIAWQGVASEDSLVEAIKLAAQFATTA
jgi:4-hydroxythreonine-4-phosphate dehydrogenase